jgi:hypothetical protein
MTERSEGRAGIAQGGAIMTECTERRECLRKGAQS